MNMFDDNLKRYEAARADGSHIYMEPDDLADIAEYYHQHGRQQEAFEAVDLAISMFPGATVPLAFRARLAILVDHNTGEAQRWADQIADKSDLEYHYIVAEIMVADMQPDEADEYLNGVLPTLDDDEAEDFYLDVATLFADYSYADLTERWLSRSSETDDAQYRELQGRIALARGQWDEGECLLNGLIDEDPYNTDYWNSMALLQYQKNDLPASVESSDYALAIDPSCAEAHLNKGNALALMGRYDEALGYYDTYRRLQPYSESGDMGIASVLTAQNKFDEALSHLRRAEQLAPAASANALEIMRQQCILNAQVGNHAEALANIRRMDEHPDHNTAENNVMRGYMFLIENQPDKARAWFMRAMEASAGDLHVQTLIAYSTYECGYTQFAHDLFIEIMQSALSRSVPEGWAFLALCDADLGLRSDFLEHLHRAMAHPSPHAQALLEGLFPQGLPYERYEDYARQHPEMAQWPAADDTP